MYEDERYKNESEICVIIDFEEAVVDKETLTLTVSGKTGCQNTKVDLSPLYYIQQPEYHQINVVGCRDEICLPTVTPFKVSIITPTGSKGIVVVGATKRLKIDIP